MQTQLRWKRDKVKNRWKERESCLISIYYCFSISSLICAYSCVNGHDKYPDTFNVQFMQQTIILSHDVPEIEKSLNMRTLKLNNNNIL